MVTQQCLSTGSSSRSSDRCPVLVVPGMAPHATECPRLLRTLTSTLLLWLSMAGAVLSPTLPATHASRDPGRALNRVFNVKIQPLVAGSSWILVQWEPDLEMAGADGELAVVISYMWSTMPGHTNQVFAMPQAVDERGFHPTSYNLTSLLHDTWYAVCLNATHTVNRFIKPSFSCSATKTLRVDGAETSLDIISKNYTIKLGATWMDIKIDEFITPFTIVHWMVVAKTSSASPRPQVVHYESHQHETSATTRRHVFHMDKLTPHTAYYVTIEARYKVNVRSNENLHEFHDNFVTTTRVSGAGRPLVDVALCVTLLTLLTTALCGV